MAILQSRSLFFGVVLLLSFALTNSKAANITDPPVQCLFLNRSSFPTGFIFGTAAASYQYEGAAKEGGRLPSIWDTYTHLYPERIKDRGNGDVAVDQYHRYEEDVGIMKSMGLDAYRFSISWSRVLPYGTLRGGMNEEGIEYYNNVIDQLLLNGLQPAVTLFHWDLPQALEDQYGGFLSHKIINHFQDYAELCFRRFGDRVKLWITINEPYVFTANGYALGSFAPGRCSSWQQLNCIGGDSSTEPYLVGHNILLAHAAAVNLYKTTYQKVQGGRIGITFNSHWFEPASESDQDKKAASRSLDFMFGWFIDPVTRGHYPQTMQHLVGNRLPRFTRNQSTLLKGSFDFLGINYYTARYAAHAPHDNSVHPSYLTDARANLLTEINGVPIGPQPGIDWLYVYPKGIHDLLVHVKETYNNPTIYVTENGVAEMNDPTLSLQQALNDTTRIDYYHHHLCYLQAAIINGSVNLKGYFAWSLLDNFEWDSGYTARFGINYVDYNDGLRRYPKHSASWLKDFLKKD